MKNKIINNNRVICGILSELSMELILVEILTPNRKDPFFSELEFIFKKPFECSKIKFKKKIENADICKCIAVFASRKISFDLVPVKNEDGYFSLPTEILIQEARNINRISGLKDKLVAEIRTDNDIILAYVYDISKCYVSLITKNEKSKLPLENSQNEIIIRSFNTNTDIYYSSMKLINIISMKKWNKLLYLNTSNDVIQYNPHYQQRANRIKIKNIVFNFKSASIGNIIISGKLDIQNISLTGFNAKIKNISGNNSIILGLTLFCEQPNISFYAVWDDGVNSGFKIQNLNNEKTLQEWLQFIKENIDSSYTEIVNSEELVNLLTNSSFLKEKRRLHYGELVSPYLVYTGKEKSNIFYRCVGFSSDLSTFDFHVSYMLFSDNSWILQEVAKTDGDSMSIYKAKEIIINELRERARFIDGQPRYFTVIYDFYLKKICDFWNSVAPNNKSIKYKSLALTNNNYLANNGKATSLFRFSSLKSKSLNERFKWLHLFDPEQLAILDYFAPNGHNIKLKTELKKNGEGHDCELIVIQDIVSTKIYGLMYKLNTYYSTNVTGLLNSAFIYLSKEITEEDIVKLIIYNSEIRNILKGIKDIQFILPYDFDFNVCKRILEKHSLLLFNYMVLDFLKDKNG